MAEQGGRNQRSSRYASTASRVLIPQFRLQHLEFTGQLDLSPELPPYDYRSNSPAYRNFPVIIQGNGEPWEIGNLYLVHKLQNENHYESRTYRGIADHLLDYLRFLEDSQLDFLYFPQNNRLKVTYRYREHLIDQAVRGEIGAGTGTARINAVVKFYREIIESRIVGEAKLGVQPFQDVYKYIKTLNRYGIAGAVKVKSHDLAIKKQTPAVLPDRIVDGGYLRPLDVEDQEIILRSLLLSSREYQLMFYFALFTGARIQTVCTLRISSLNGAFDKDDMLRLKVGVGTGIDTKGGRQMVLLVPGWLIRDIKVYVKSEEAVKRQSRAFYRESDENYVFLSKNGNPYYTSKKEIIDRERAQRYGSGGGGENANMAPLQDGAAIRQFISEILLPRIYSDNENFQKFTFHDLRATFGMNLLESLLGSKGDDRVTEVLDEVQQRMGHKDKKTTLQYLNFKSRLKRKNSVQSKFETRLFKYVNTSGVPMVIPGE